MSSDARSVESSERARATSQQVGETTEGKRTADELPLVGAEDDTLPFGEYFDDADAPSKTATFAFGRYQIKERIGAGSMGVVYRAYDPMLERHVALKIVRPAQGGAAAQRRLFREAQLLAQVRHPNVVSVYDVGTVGKDVFVAMELAKDTVPLWIWQKRRDWREVLRAYREAGKGLAAAHERGLIHRDFKPQNVLVDARGNVTVIDFGLAALMDCGESELSTDTSLSAAETPSSLNEKLTQAGALVGTPRYMAPEQHTGGERVDALSDQYSFALSLYEALAERWPFVKNGSARDKTDELRIAKLRGVFAPPARAMPTHLRRVLQRALVTEPGDRFPSMVALLQELGKDPARARRRQLVAVAVVLSLVFGTWSAIVGRDDGVGALCQGAAKELAETWNSTQREAVKKAFLASGVSYANDTFERVASIVDEYGKDWTEMRTETCQATHVHGVQSEKVLDLRMGCLERKRRSLQALVSVFADKPDRQVVDKAVEASLGLGRLAMCADPKALEQEVELPERPEDRQTLAELRGRLEDVSQLGALWKYQEAEALLRELAPRVEALGFPPLQAEFAYYDALIRRFLGRYTEAEPILRAASQTALQWGMKELAANAGAEATYLVGYLLGRHAAGLIHGHYTEGLTRGRGDELEARALQTLATLYNAQGENDKAEQLNQRALKIREKALGSDHPYVALSLFNLANVYFDQGKYAEAERLHKRTLSIWQKSLAPEHPNVALPLSSLGNIYRAQGKYAEAEKLHKHALAVWEKAFGPEHHYVGSSLHNLADVYGDQGKHGKAEKFYKRALAIWEKEFGPEHPHVAWPLVGLAETYEKERRLIEALPLLERARQIRDRAKVAPKERAIVAFAFARVYWALGKEQATARSLAQEALTLYRTAGSGADKERLEAERWIAEHR